MSVPVPDPDPGPVRHPDPDVPARPVAPAPANPVVLTKAPAHPPELAEPARDPAGADPAGADPAGAEPAGAEPAAAEPAAAEPAGAEPAGAEPAGAEPAPRRVDASRLAALAAVLVTTLALATVAGVLFQRSRDAAAVEDYYRPTSAPLEAARTAAKVLFSYDHRNLDRDFAAGAALSTGVFRAEYARTTARVVREVATQYRAVVVAEPVVAGVQAAEPGEVVAVLFVNQSTQSTRVEGTKVDQSRVRMTLVERGDTWLVSKVEAL